jgi:hypothetical protein
MRRVILILDNADFRVLDKTNPYSHFSIDNPRASKFCRGRLFEGVMENNIMLRRDDRWREYWNDDDEEEQQQQHHVDDDDDDEFRVGLGYFGL